MREIKGNIKGIRDSVIAELQKLYDMQSPQLVSQELAVKLADITEYINREISVYITRSGQIIEIAVGDNATVELPSFSGRRGAGRLSGIRCIHTHPGGNPYLSGVDISALKNNKYDAMVAIGVVSPDFTKSELTFGLITGIDSNENYTAECYGPYSIEDAENINFVNTVSTIERILDKQTGTASLQVMSERAILIGMEWGRNDSLWTVDDSLEELKQLADTAGATVIIQKRPKPDPAFFIGRGKVQELALYAQQENIDLCIFDDELSPAQQRNIESVMGIRILDRTALILDIFAQRARTNEGKLQVELAQLQYTLPRIMGKGLMLSRLGGGIGTRGPGETKLEVDRRRIRDRIAFMRICSGVFKKGMTVYHMQGGKPVKLAQPQQFLAQERTIVEEAYPGDIIGIFDPGIFGIGDSLSDEKLKIQFEDFPVFPPEIFARVQPKDSLKRKQFEKGIVQLAQEGAIQVFRQKDLGIESFIVGVVGSLQLEVLEYRLLNEYSAQLLMNQLGYSVARWVYAENEKDIENLKGLDNGMLVYDKKDRPVILVNNEWALNWILDRNPNLQFLTVPSDVAKI